MDSTEFPIFVLLRRLPVERIGGSDFPTIPHFVGMREGDLKFEISGLDWGHRSSDGSGKKHCDSIYRAKGARFGPIFEKIRAVFFRG